MPGDAVLLTPDTTDRVPGGGRGRAFMTTHNNDGTPGHSLSRFQRARERLLQSAARETNKKAECR